jgi:hypothetical protein
MQIPDQLPPTAPPPGMLSLNEIQAKRILWTYSALLVLGLFVALYVLLTANPVLAVDYKTPLLGSIGMALIGSTTYYIRKIYKASISKNIDFSPDSADRMVRFGTMAYFLMRPLFSCGFVIMSYLFLVSGLNVLIEGDATPSLSFLYLNMVLGFFVGFKAGDFLPFLEKRAPEFFEKIGKIGVE